MQQPDRAMQDHHAAPNTEATPAVPQTDRRALLAGIGGLAAGAILAGKAHAGPLTPPSGPITSTAGPEPRTAINDTNTPGDANSLFKITEPGSYYLTGNITGVSGKHGIEITSSGVTLDLNGFDLVGVSGMGAFDGVAVTVNGLTNITVLNGSVRGWGDGGIDLFVSINCRIEGVAASRNSGNGISAGSSIVVSHCTAYLNTGDGINVGSDSVVSDCTAYDNEGSGISVSPGNTVTNCTANSNGLNGIYGTSIGVRISHCATHLNTLVGIQVFKGSTVSNSTASLNILGGIGAADGSTVSNCIAYQNEGSGISAGSGCTISECTAHLNTDDGIKCDSSCVMRNNVTSDNGGVGIRASGNDNRIEGNNSTNASWGVRVDGSGNLIVRNSCSGNTTNWLITAGNVCGPIIDRTAPGSANISGDSAPDSTGSPHPNANFSF